MKIVARTSTSLLVSLMVVLGILQPHVWSYEVETHADISEKAYGSAKINDFLSEQLGISGNQGLARREFLFQRRRPPVEWLRQGSKDQDSGLRFLNHFLDPIYNRGLTVGVRLGERADEWALESPQEYAVQDSSYKDARDYFRRSLTEADPKDRDHWLATTFYTLGHVIHLIQDMASPPHTRNAPHAGGVLGPFSVVEKYLDLGPVRQRLTFSGYDLPRAGFTQARAFWVQTDASGNPQNGPSARGLSQIINRNFVSEGTNFTAFQNGDHAPEYANPVLNTQDCYDEEVSTQDAEARPVAGLVTFCRNSFTDPNTGKLETNPRMTTFSLFSRDLRERGKSVPGGEFSLNALNAWSIGQLTIPRAVGYSAGLLDYFFRGELDFVLYPDRSDPAQLNLLFWNNSTETMTGSFTLYTEDKQGRRVPVPGVSVEGITLSGTETPDGEDSYEITFTLDPAVKLGGLTLVFSGTLGAEEGAVAEKVKPWQPTLFAVQELAEFTEPSRLNTYLPELIPEDESWAGEITRSNDPTKQRAQGYFYASEEPMPGRFIKRVWVAGATGTRLRLNGVDVGQIWSRETGPPLDPTTWEIIIDGGWRPSSLAFESTSGETTFAPLAWWQGVYAVGRAEIAWGCCNSRCTGPLRGETRVSNGLVVSVLFGDYAEGVWPSSEPYTSSGYVPLTGLGGYALGTVPSSGEEPFNYNACTETGDYTWRGGIVFAWPGSDPSNPMWNESYAQVGEGHLTFGPRPDRTRPPIPTVPEPSALPTLIYKRSYRPDELLWYGYLGVTPPQYQLELR